jgi:hypothetical protein
MPVGGAAGRIHSRGSDCFGSSGRDPGMVHFSDTCLGQMGSRECNNQISRAFVRTLLRDKIRLT